MQAGAANGAEQEKGANCLKALWGQENPEERNGYRNRGARELLVAEQKQPSATHGGRRRGEEGGREGGKRDKATRASRAAPPAACCLRRGKSFSRRRALSAESTAAALALFRKKALSPLFPAVRLNPVQTYSRVNP